MTKDDYFKYRIQGGDIYVLPEDIFNELFDELSNLQRENKKYKEVIDKTIKYLENKRIREKAIVDVDVLEGILKEVE